MKKKWIAVFLTAWMMFGVCACGGGTIPENSAQENSAQEAGNNEQGGGTAEPDIQTVLPLTDYVNEEEMALADQWQVCDDTALAGVMKKAAAGEPVTIACIGGSITQGTVSKGTADGAVGFSTPYAEIFRQWWENTFPQADITFINAGIGGTDSYLGVHRAKRDVLGADPDLVLVEYAVNDADSHFYKRSYENLLRNLLQSESAPAVMLLFMAQTNGATAQGSQVLVGFHYALPMVSYANCIKSMMETGHYTAAELSGDEVHPSALGHAIAGELLWKYLNVVCENLDSFGEAAQAAQGALTDDRYQNAAIVDASSVIEQETGTFCRESKSEYFPDGWVCREGEGGLTVTMTFRNLGILYLATTDGKSGAFDIWIDGECVWTINADFTGGWGNAINAKEVYASDEAAEHTVVIKKSPESERDIFILLGFLTS